MAYVRRQWLASVLYVTIIVLGLAIFLTPTLFSENAPEAAQAQPTELQPIDPYLYTRVQKLRQELSLTNRDLAAMGYTEESAKLLLESLKAWAVTNNAILNQQHHDEVQAKTALRETTRLINLGLADKNMYGNISFYQNDLAEIHKKRKMQHDDLRAQIELGMDDNQINTWHSAIANTGLPDKFSYVPDISDQQRKDIVRRIRDQLLKKSPVDQALNGVFTLSQNQAVNAINLNIIDNIQAIREAESQVLSVPTSTTE